MNRILKSCITAFVPLLAFAGCRLGNYSEPPKAPPGTTIQNLDLFATEPKQFILEVYFTDTNTPAANNNVALGAIPTDVLGVFSDPVYLGTVTANSVSAPFFFGFFSTSSYMQTVVTNNHIDGVSDAIIPSYLSPPSGCSVLQQTQQLGDLVRSSGTTYTSPSGAHYPLAGRLTLDYSFVIQFTGNSCGAWLQTLANCYTPGNSCTSDQITQAHSLFDLYLKQSSVIQVTDATRIKALAYLVHFE